MNDWTEATNRELLSAPWTSFSSSGKLLVKLHLKKTRDGQLRLSLLLVTNLEQCFLEIVDQRKLVQRIIQAYTKLAADSQDTQSQSFTGVGEEGEQQLLDMILELVDVVRAGRARCEIEHAGYDHIVRITLPSGLVLEFVCDSLDQRSASCLSTQLLTPVLGISASLLSLHAEDEQAIETVLDVSAKAERLSEGRACKNFFAEGGSGLLRRWCQGVRGEKVEALAPISLFLSSNPAQHASHPAPSANSSKRAASFSPPSSPSKFTLPKLSMAQQILSNDSKGERVEWDETQLLGQGPRSSFAAAKETGTEAPGAAEEEEEEPVTEDEEEDDLSFPPAVRQPPRFPPMDVEPPQAPQPSPVSFSQPTEVFRPTPEDSSGEKPERSPEEKKKAAKEREKAEEKQHRRQTVLRARAAMEAKASAGKKKQGKKL